MKERRLGIVMHGVTGRMGKNQHLIRSILAIRDQGGVALADGTRLMPDPIIVGRNADRIEALAKSLGIARWSADLDAALADPDDTVFFDAASTKLRPDLLRKATDVWTAIGAQVLRMTPENHDAAFAAVSHLPHLLAFAYFSAVVNQPAGRDFLSLAGPGFRDFTRIAASNPETWRDILVANREEVLKQSQRFRHALDALEHVMREANAEALEDLIRGPAQGRSRWQMGAPRVPGSDKG